MSPKDIVAEMSLLSGCEVNNWQVQCKLASILQSKYKDAQIIYALQYYHNKGLCIYSLGFLTNDINMKDPMTEFAAIQNIRSEDSGERNRKRISETEYRAEYPVGLFTES